MALLPACAFQFLFYIILLCAFKSPPRVTPAIGYFAVPNMRVLTDSREVLEVFSFHFDHILR